MYGLEEAFTGRMPDVAAGGTAIAARAEAVDHLVTAAWQAIGNGLEEARHGLALVAVGGYGRRELFPSSDVDLMVLVDGKVPERSAKDAIRLLGQSLWDSGLRAATMTRSLAECERFDAENVEFTLSLLDARFLVGDSALAARLLEKSMPRLIAKDGRKIGGRLLEVTRVRHAKYGSTLFHLEPNVKECPGGLRDVHVCHWLEQLQLSEAASVPEFTEATRFMTQVRVFLHLRHKRDNNTLDWAMQDEAAAAALASPRGPIDASYWMRLYFRHARAIERRLVRAAEGPLAVKPKMSLRAFGLGKPRLSQEETDAAFTLRGGVLELLSPAPGQPDPAESALTVLDLFGAVARTGAHLAAQTELRLEQAIPRISADLEDGPVLWLRLTAILNGRFAGAALRGMHALGLLELVIPEFHGIDALVIRDAYHRYTVDEHTFVLVDTLHRLPLEVLSASAPGRDLWAERFGGLLRELPHRPLLFLAALLHDVGKGQATANHARESARMAQAVLERLELDAYETGLVLSLIRDHLEMSATLRRDVFDTETIRAFAARVGNPESLRMLTLFTYADIAAVHPDALTPWKAENLWRLYIATANFLDRNVDEERIATAADPLLTEVLDRIHAALPGRRAEAELFLKGFPRRYLQTRTPEQIRTHFDLASRLSEQSSSTEQLDFRFAPGVSELTLITRDRPMLFAGMAGALAAWGMNILTADAFSNADGIIVDSFRFTDTFKTLEMNVSERTRFLESVQAVISGAAALEPMLAARRRGRRRAPKIMVPTRIDFDNLASSQSTLLQVEAQDGAGLLRALSLAIADHECNIEVALIDTEGEMAIDVFYLTQGGLKLDDSLQIRLRHSLSAAIASLSSDLQP